MDSPNHVLLEHEPAWRRFCSAVIGFLGVSTAETAEARAFDGLSSRERAIVALLTDGLGNAQIGEELGVSEKTVRNQVSRVFDRLGVHTRAQARDHGFRSGSDAP